MADGALPLTLLCLHRRNLPRRDIQQATIGDLELRHDAEREKREEDERARLPHAQIARR